MTDEIFERSRSLLGEDAFNRISGLNVAIFGVGGVGGWCAEALVRTGVRRITLIDDDSVAVSNINRQRQATPATVGRMKVEVLRDILLDVLPDAEITAIAERYTPETASRFDGIISGADFVVDAIDSVDCKYALVRHCLSSCAVGGKPTVFSSMGAALRTDPTKVCVSPFRKIVGDGLARALRGRFRKDGIPLPSYLCVHSDELPSETADGVKGSLMPVTCTFGMTLAHLVLDAIAD